MKNEILQKNISSLEKYNVFILKALQTVDFSNINAVFEEKAKCGLDTLSFYKDGKKYLLHSKYNPDAEAQRLMKNIDFNKDSLIIVFGLGLGYHLVELKDKISPDTRVIIIEHDLDVLKYALTHIDLSPIFDIPQFLLVFGDKQQMAELIIYQTGANFYNLAYNIQTLMLPNYHAFGEENKWVMKQITKYLSSVIISYGNALDDMLTGFKNNYLNIDAIMNSNSISEITNKYQGVPAIVVASGPSLDKNIHHLKSAYGKALIIACDASMRACESNDVKPDAVASIERDEPTYTYYYKDRTYDKDIVLVGPGLLWPKIYEEYLGKTIIMSKRFDGVENWWFNHFENIEFVNQGQSSATVAFAVAKAAGCNPIILIGQDLAFTEGKKHSDLTHTEYEGVNDDREADGVYLEDYEGNLLPSDIVYKIFKEWYEYQIALNSEIEVIDATEGGAYIQGTKVMTLEEAIKKYCNLPLKDHLVSHLKDVVIAEKDRITKYKTIIEDINEQISKLKKVAKNSREHFLRLDEIEKEFEIDKCSDEELEFIVIKMQEGDKVIQEILYSNDSLKSFYQQIITQTIIFVKKIGNEITAENVKRNIELQKNLMYMIEKSTDIIAKEFEAAKEFVKEKKMQLQV